MTSFLAAAWSVLRVALYGWFLSLVRFIRQVCAGIRKRRAEATVNERIRRAAKTRCVPIRDPAFVRPDPLIYSQKYLAAHGLAYSWNNPDFALFRHADGKPVGAHELEADTAYDVVVRLWNASLDCPVVAMPVHLSYLSFGVGTVSHAVAIQQVDIGVKGGANNPAFVAFLWTTPKDKGHYCLQALLDPTADVEFGNNLGQHNTDVVHSHSPATFSFELRNDTERERTYRFAFDAYELGVPGPCPERSTVVRDRAARHRAAPPLPAGWEVRVEPASPRLAAGASISVAATVTPPAVFTGAQTINVHAYYRDDYEDRLAGGITISVRAGG
jgi:hypothetical protein